MLVRGIFVYFLDMREDGWPDFVVVFNGDVDGVSVGWQFVYYRQELGRVTRKKIGIM